MNGPYAQRRCRRCGLVVRYIARRFVWVHVKHGVDHAPEPA